MLLKIKRLITNFPTQVISKFRINFSRIFFYFISIVFPIYNILLISIPLSVFTTLIIGNPLYFIFNYFLC